MLEQFLAIILDPYAIFTATWAMTLGIIMGAMPGLTGPMAMALLLGLAYQMSIEYSAVAMVLIYMGGVYGGSMSAILLNVPGAPASAATAIDGYQLAQQGRAGQTIAMVTVASALGGLIATVIMALLTPTLVQVSLVFTSWELLMLVVLGVLMAGSLSSDDPLKGWIAGFMGLLIAQIGLDDIHMYPRFSYGSNFLEAGIGLIAAIVGLFGISQVMMSMRERESMVEKVVENVHRVIPRWSDIKGRARVIIQSSFIGTFIGILPGLGADMGAWISYDAARRTSRNPQEYGKGSMEGVIAAETGNNAVVPGSLIPVIALGLPGSAGAAIIMAALFLHGVIPGPRFLTDNLDLFHYIVVSLAIGCVLLLVIGLILAHGIIYILTIPRENVMAVVLALAAMGAYASKLQFNDLWMMLAFGLLAYGMRRLGFPLAPLVLGIVLGRLLDVYLRNSLVISRGSMAPLWERPITGILFILALIVLATGLPPVQRFLRRRLGSGTGVLAGS